MIGGDYAVASCFFVVNVELLHTWKNDSFIRSNHSIGGIVMPMYMALPSSPTAHTCFGSTWYILHASDVAAAT